MRLMPPEWRTAWYEDGLSERFAQEMTRLEKSELRTISTSAQWVEQLVIELGQLTQNMIHLEGEAPRPNQLKLALERALKLAALSAHLMAALDTAVDHGPSVLRYSEAGLPGRAHGLGEGAPPVPPHLSPTPQNPMQPAWGGPEAHGSFAGHGHGAAAPAPASAAVHPTPPSPPAAPASAAAQSLRASAQVQVGLQRQAQAAPAPRPAAPEARDPLKGSPIISNLIETSQPMIEGSPSPAREMILALSRRGLSRSEIEVITEQPRHIIEAVLQRG